MHSVSYVYPLEIPQKNLLAVVITGSFIAVDYTTNRDWSVMRQNQYFVAAQG